MKEITFFSLDSLKIETLLLDVCQVMQYVMCGGKWVYLNVYFYKTSIYSEDSVKILSKLGLNKKGDKEH